MSKTYEELATELTIAWVKSVGDVCATGKFSGTWLEVPSVTNAYQQIFKSISNSVNTESDAKPE